MEYESVFSWFESIERVEKVGIAWNEKDQHRGICGIQLILLSRVIHLRKNATGLDESIPSH